MKREMIRKPIAVVILIVGLAGAIYGEDVHIDGTLWIGLDIPRIYVLLRETPGGEPMQDPEFGFIPIDAFLDTGASGMVISDDSATILGVQAELNAAYMDVGVGGWEEFEVSQELYMAVADRAIVDPLDEGEYGPDLGPWRLQMTMADDDLIGPLDIWGVPLMAGQVAVLDPTPLDSILDYFHANIVAPGSAEIPEVDFHVRIRFRNFVYRNHPDNSGPLPTLAYNPVIDDVRINEGANESTGTWLLDTGATVSMISVGQAQALGLVDANGDPLVTPDFTAPIGGVGGTNEVPGFQIDAITLPMLEGFNLVYDNPYVVVLDVGTIDEATGEPIILDGIFGTNLLAASATLSLDIVAGPYNKIVVDTVNGVLGFDFKYGWDNEGAIYCGDPNHPWRPADVDRNCLVGGDDLLYVAKQWLAQDCGPFTWDCERTDINRDGQVDLADLRMLATEWMTNNGVE
ncbi:MAG: hypothetical protein JW936_05385 [Sedimentisphaerales bacterium]|nr:hypothetical protein [Sedimentisphaerales bacterium]